MSRPYNIQNPRSYNWKPEEDAILREFSRLGCGWIAKYRLPNRSIDAINARRRYIERKDGIRLPRNYGAMVSC
jgi:hypothetical protein